MWETWENSIIFQFLSSFSNAINPVQFQSADKVLPKHFFYNLGAPKVIWNLYQSILGTMFAHAKAYSLWLLRRGLHWNAHISKLITSSRPKISQKNGILKLVKLWELAELLLNLSWSFLCMAFPHEILLFFKKKSLWSTRFPSSYSRVLD